MAGIEERARPGLAGASDARLCAGLRVLFMSGYSDEAVSRHGIIRPDTSFIEKPFSQAAALARKVREVLAA